MAVRGGVIPRKAKQQVARGLVDNFKEQADAAFPGLDEPAQLRAIKEATERLFRRSVADNPLPRAMSRECVRHAWLALSEEAETPALSEFWVTLGGVVEYTMYGGTDGVL